MKIKCACGIKYAFDITPEMAHQPVRFVCQSCGLDSSEAVNQAIRQELAADGVPPRAPAPAPAPAPAHATVPTPIAMPKPSGTLVPPTGSPGLRVALSAHAAAPETSSPSGTATATPGVASAARLCSRHPGQQIGHTCVVCGKPMCPECMAISGVVCSPYCHTKAEAQGLDLPVYQFQKSVVERRRWRKVGLVFGSIAAVILAGLGFWFWYAWIGSVPKVAYAHRFQDPGYSGRMHLAENDQLVVLHGGTLTRHDLVGKRQIWSLELLDKTKIASDSAAELEAMKKSKERAVLNGADATEIILPTLQEIIDGNTRAAAAAYQLEVSGQNVWLVSPGKLTRYAWDSGKSDKEISLPEDVDNVRRAGGELLFVSDDNGPLKSTLRVDLNSGESQAEGRRASLAAADASGNPRSGTKPGGTGARPGELAAGGTGTKPLNPAALANKVQNLPLPNKLALPATISAAANQQRLAAAMQDDETVRPAVRPVGGRKPPEPESVQQIRTSDGTLEFVTRLLEEKIVLREAMKAAPKKSALEGPVNAAATMEIANELLNEMQRDRFGSTVEENESRYQVTVRRPGKGVPEWTGEMIGSPGIHPLKTIDVLAAGKGLVVLDKGNKKLWDSKLNYPVFRDIARDEEEPLAEGEPHFGDGPCIERGETLYVFDQGVLTSFAKSSGTVHWRLPSVGIVGIWFDDEGMLYLNTTTASPESIRYSKQIDVSSKNQNQVIKVDPQSGKTLWTAVGEGFVSYIWSKYVFTSESHPGEDPEDEVVLGVKSGFEIPPHIRIKRLDADNGRVLWEHYQMRSPLDVRFDRNRIQLLFKREVQFLKFVVL